MGTSSATHGGAYSEKIPPMFDGHSSYDVYRADVELWNHYTSVAETKRGVALIGRLYGEAKSSAKSLGTAVIFAADGAKKILDHLDSLYRVDETDQLDSDLASFLDYSWDHKISVEAFIAGFHSRLDKLTELNLDSKLQGHLLLRQAGLDFQSKNVIVGAASGSYEVRSIANSLRQAYRLKPGSDSYPTGRYSSGTQPELICYYCKEKGHKKNQCPKLKLKREENRRNQEEFRSMGHSSAPTFYSYPTTTVTPINALVDTGGANSIVGKETLTAAMMRMGVNELPNGKIRQAYHGFGDSKLKKKSIAAVVVPFKLSTIDNKKVEFNISFDVIEGDLPFLIGFPSLELMDATVGCRTKILSLTVDKLVYRVQMICDGTHIFLPVIEPKGSYYSLPVSKYYLNGNSPTHGQGEIYRIGEDTSPEGNDENHSSFLESNQHPSLDGVVSVPEERPAFEYDDLKKLHLQLRHGALSEMRTWLKTAGKWDSNLELNIKSLIEDCGCGDADHPKPHAKVSVKPPVRNKQQEVAVDVVFLEVFEEYI